MKNYLSKKQYKKTMADLKKLRRKLKDNILEQCDIVFEMDAVLEEVKKAYEGGNTHAKV